MTAKKGPAGKWCRVTVSIREDLLAQAQASSLDIGDLCNRALAAKTGMQYPPRRTATAVPVVPVIIAQDGGPVKEEIIPAPVAAGGVHPVINADDPRAAAAVKQVQRPPAKKAPAELPGRISSPDMRSGSPAIRAPVQPDPQPKKLKSRPVKKGGTRDSPIKRFVTTMIIRDDADEDHVTKEILYQTFTRWCREHRIARIPDSKAFSIALKNQFAMTEKAVDGEPSWVTIRIR